MTPNVRIASDPLADKRTKLTPRGRHATEAMMALVRHDKDTPLCLADIALSGDISLSYMEQLFAGLRRQGLVISARGPGGGYRLARPAKSITLNEIFAAAEDSTPARRGRKAVGQSSSQSTETEYLWDYIERVLYQHLSSITLQDLLERNINLS